MLEKCHGININIEQNAKYRGNIYVMNVVVNGDCYG